MPMTRVSDSVLHSADQLKTRLQAITGERTWRRLTRDIQFGVALRATSYLTDDQLTDIMASLLETGDNDDAPDVT